MKQIFGHFIELVNNGNEYLKIGFSPTKRPLQQRWRNNGLSADFLADYLSTFFPVESSSARKQQTQIKDVISFIANELLENAMKFNYPPSECPVSIEIYLEEDNVTFYVTNTVHPKCIENFQHWIQRLLTEDADALYMEKLMQNTEDEKSEDKTETQSGLGYLTMINDYGVKLAWKFTPIEGNADGMTVTTMAQLTV